MTDRLIIATALLAVACDRPVELGSGYRLMADSPTTPPRALDVLFVVDDSGAMGEEQELFAAGIARFIATLDERMGGRPDLHIGVTSTNVGTGPFGGGGESCSGDGDDGRLLVPETCPALDLPYLIDLADPDDPDARVINYPEGQLAETLGCMTRLGTNGCGFEQPFEAMRRALARSSGGFLRRDAMLLVVIVSDEDDCSAFDREVYDPTVDDREEPLGELSSFRCFEFGVTCDQPEPRAIGERTGCVPRADSPYIEHPDTYADFLAETKGGPGMVMVAAITGDPGPVEVFEEERRTPPELAVGDLCPQPDPDDTGIFPSGAVPAIRTNALLEALPRHTARSICDRDMAGHLRRVADDAASSMAGSMCLWATPFDSDDSRAGIQAACRAELRLESGEWTELLACDQDATGQSCFEIREDRLLCGHTSSRLIVAVNGLTLPGERVRVECLAARD